MTSVLIETRVVSGRYSDAEDGPQFSPIFIGVINMVGYFSMFVGVAIYNKYMTTWNYRYIFTMAQVRAQTVRTTVLCLLVLNGCAVLTSRSSVSTAPGVCRGSAGHYHCVQMEHSGGIPRRRDADRRPNSVSDGASIRHDADLRPGLQGVSRWRRGHSLRNAHVAIQLREHCGYIFWVVSSALLPRH